MKVMIDGFNLSLAKGTGVATYTRNLATTVKQLGYDVSILYGTRTRYQKNRLLDEITFIENLESKPSNFWNIDKYWSKLRAFLLSFTGSQKARKITMSGRLEAQSLTSCFVGQDETWNISELYFTCFAFFKLTGRFLTVEFEDTPDIAHWTYPIPIRVKGARNIYTLHDLIPLKLPFATLDNKLDYYKLCKKIGRDADGIVTVSENSKRDICELLDVDEKRVFNTYQSVNIPAMYSNITDEALTSLLKQSYRLDRKEYFLFVGAVEPKKNIGRLLEAYLGSNIDIPLVMVGPDAWLAKAELAILKSEEKFKFQIEGNIIRKIERVIRLNYVPFYNLVHLVKGARCLVFPSLYEGFGLPVLEAMALETAVITSNNSSLAEIAKDAAILVNPYDVLEIREAMQRINDQKNLEDLVTKGVSRSQEFSTELYAQKVQSAYAQILGAN